LIRGFSGSLSGQTWIATLVSGVESFAATFSAPVNTSAFSSAPDFLPARRRVNLGGSGCAKGRAHPLLDQNRVLLVGACERLFVPSTS
jgi:hypothetical protein